MPHGPRAVPAQADASDRRSSSRRARPRGAPVSRPDPCLLLPFESLSPAGDGAECGTAGCLHELLELQSRARDWPSSALEGQVLGPQVSSSSRDRRRGCPGRTAALYSAARLQGESRSPTDRLAGSELDPSAPRRHSGPRHLVRSDKGVPAGGAWSSVRSGGDHRGRVLRPCPPSLLAGSSPRAPSRPVCRPRRSGRSRNGGANPGHRPRALGAGPPSSPGSTLGAGHAKETARPVGACGDAGRASSDTTALPRFRRSLPASIRAIPSRRRGGERGLVALPARLLSAFGPLRRLRGRRERLASSRWWGPCAARRRALRAGCEQRRDSGGAASPAGRDRGTRN